MKLINLTGKKGSVIGNYVMVDDEDYDYLNQWVWHYGGNGSYAVRSFPIPKTEGNQKYRPTGMHRIIMKLTDPKVYVDHIYGNGLNNQRSNLRIATNSQNSANRKIASKSKYLGVCIQKVTNKYGTEYTYWKATCKKDNVVYQKHCKTKIEAALQYNEWAKELHGEFARLNIIRDEDLQLQE